MTKQEMAEFMAEKVLGWELFHPAHVQGVDWYSHGDFKCRKNLLIRFIYSPDGFFAVLNALHQKIADAKLTSIERISFWSRFNGMLGGYQGEKLFQAFYSAIYEVMKDD